MKKIIAVATAFALIGGGGLLWSWKPNTTKVSFAKSDWDSAKAKAIAEKKLYFVDFDASYCATCRNMDQSTYMDGNLASYIEENVVALRMDVQDFDGVMWSQKYEVEALPTMLVFDSKGKLIKRLVGYKSAADLMQTFKEIRASEANPAPTPTPAPINDDKPLVRNDKATPSPTPTPTPAPTPTPVPAPTVLGLYEVAVRKQAPKGYSLQVGVFKSYDSVLDRADAMRELFEQKTIIQVDRVNSEPVFRLLVGNFENRSDAANFQKALKKNNIEGIIKDLRGI